MYNIKNCSINYVAVFFGAMHKLLGNGIMPVATPWITTCDTSNGEP